MENKLTDSINEKQSIADQNCETSQKVATPEVDDINRYRLI
jgi:serine/threonine protein kinase